MPVYKDLSGKSGVLDFEIGPDWIEIHFERGGRYVYTTHSAGDLHISEMKRLAHIGEGLNTYINKNKPAYERKSA